MAKAVNAKVTSSPAGNSGKANGYITRPNQGHAASRTPRKVIFGAGGAKAAPNAAPTTKKS
jgi:hypothetical protein